MKQPHAPEEAGEIDESTSGRKPEPLRRWSLHQAAADFTIDRTTLRNKLVQLQVNPGADGKYSTAQVCAAKYGDMAGEKLGKARADREKAEIEAAKAKAEVVLTEDADGALADYGTAVRSVIESARYMGEDARAKLLASIHAIEIDPAPMADGTPRKTTEKKS